MVAAVLAFSLALLSALSADTSGSPAAVPDQVVGRIASGKYAEAIADLHKILLKDERNGVAWYHLGLAYNRLALYAKAGDALARAAIHGSGSPELRRELGIALAGQGKPKEAMEHLRQARPDDAEAAYARALVAHQLGRVDEAKEALVTAQRDSAFKDRATKFLSDIESGRASMQKRWRLQLTLGTAWNTNVTYRPQEAVRAVGERADRQAPSGTLAFDGGYTLWQQGPARVDATFSLSEVQYRHLERFARTNMSVGLEMTREFEGWRAWATPMVQKGLVDHDNYRTAFALSLGLEKPLASWCSVQGNYALNAAHYHFRAIKDEELDGATHHFAIGPRLWTPGGRLAGYAQVTFDEARHAGDAMQHKALGAELGVNVKLLSTLGLNSSLTLLRPDYTKKNLRHPTNLKRADRTAIWYTALVYQLRKNQQIELFYSYVHNHSNIRRFYKYDQRQIGMYYRYMF